MKIVVFFLLTTIICSAQDNFSINKNQIHWQKIYNNTTDRIQIKKQLLQNSSVKNIEEIENTLIISVNDMLLDYEGAGKKSSNTSIYIQGCRFNFIASIDFKDEKYRVTIKNITGAFNFTAGFFTEGEIISLESAALRKKNTEFRPGFEKNDAEIFNYSFSKMFLFNNEVDTNW